jgi:tetratricopeptide (TPR) repeat protein
MKTYSKYVSGILPMMLLLAVPNDSRSDDQASKPAATESSAANPAADKTKTDDAKNDQPLEVKISTVDEATAKKAEEQFEAGRNAFFQGDYGGAVEKLKSAVNSNPEKIGYKLLLAKAYRYSDKTEQAVTVLEQILKTNAEHVEAGIELSELLDPQKQPDRVIAVLLPLLKFKHDYPVYHLLAEASFQKEKFDDARKYYEEAIKLNNKNSGDHYQLGRIYLNQKRFAKAATAYEMAGALGHDSGVYHFQLASIYFNLHNYLGTVSTAEVRGGEVGEIKENYFLIDRLPGTKDTFFVAGPRSAIFQAVKARQMGIKDFQLRFLEANAWYSARRYAKADPIYKELEPDVKPADAGLFWYYWATTALGLDEYDNYLARLEKAIAAEPATYKSTLADAYVTVANRHHQQGAGEKYIEFLRKAVSISPLSPRLHLLLGDAYWLDNQREKALEQYKLVLELEQDHPQRVRLLNRIRGQEETTGSTIAGS